MRLYLLRHADAVDAGPRIRDEHRFLTARGRDDSRGVGRALAAAGVRFDVVLTSPLVRAVQTAELVAFEVEYEGEVRALAPLGIGDVRTAVAVLEEIEGDVVAVGHEPSIRDMAASLSGRHDFPPFRKTQIVCVEAGRATWSLAPGDAAPRPL